MGRAVAAPVPPGFGRAAAGPGPAATLAEADAALDAGELDRAGALYESVARGAPDSVEAAQARRALKILAVTHARSPSTSAPRDGKARNIPGPVHPAATPPTPLAGARAQPEKSDAPLEVKGAALGGEPSTPAIVNREVPYSTRTKERLRLTIWEKV
ncbi:MAG TPA: hypothetical protein VIU64_01935, partial [Polyangia bacterium]